MADAQQLARVGLWLWDVGSDTVQLSDELYRICGVDPLDFDGTLAAYLDVVHPEDRPGVLAGLEHAVDEQPLGERHALGVNAARNGPNHSGFSWMA